MPIRFWQFSFLLIFWNSNLTEELAIHFYHSILTIWPHFTARPSLVNFYIKLVVSFQVAKGQLVAKQVEFTCLPQGRVAELYVQKANNGQELPELRNLDTSFEAKVEQPKRCVSSILKA